MTVPVNHLASMREGNTYERLKQLTDDRLNEQAGWFASEQRRLMAESPDGRTYGNRYASYKMGVYSSAIYREQQRRRNKRARHHPPLTFEERSSLLHLAGDGHFSAEEVPEIRAFCDARGWTGDLCTAIIDRLRDVFLPHR